MAGDLHVNAMVSRDQRTFAVGVAARAHVAADQLEASALRVTLGDGKHGHVQGSGRRKAAARHQNQRRLVGMRQAALESVVGERIAVIRLGHGLGRGSRRASREICRSWRRRRKDVCSDATHGCGIRWMVVNFVMCVSVVAVVVVVMVMVMVLNLLADERDRNRAGARE